MNRPQIIDRLSMSSLLQSQRAVSAFEKYAELEISPYLCDVDSLARTYETRFKILQEQDGNYAARLSEEVSEFLGNLRGGSSICLVAAVIRADDPYRFIVFAENDTFEPLSCLKVKPSESESKLRIDENLGIDI